VVSCEDTPGCPAFNTVRVNDTKPVRWHLDYRFRRDATSQQTHGVLLVNGMFGPAEQQIKADGTDQKVPETGYWGTRSAQILDDRTVQIISKSAGKTMFTEVDTVSADGKTLTQIVKDATEAQAATIETLNKRLEKGPGGSHALSGSWQAYKVNRSKNGSLIPYRSTVDGFSAKTPPCEGFDAKFDDKFYPVEDDPARTMVKLKLLDFNTVEQTNKRNGKIVSVLRLTVAPDGKTIHATYENEEDNTTTRSEMRKQAPSKKASPD
jgi:hypothetical protein